MVKVEESVMIDRPVEEVWKFIADLSNVPKWEPGVLEARLTSSGPIGVGSTCEIIRKDMTLPQRCIEYEPNRKLSFVVTSGPAKGTVVGFGVEAVEGKTRFTSADDVKFDGFYRLLAPFVTGGLRREGVATVGNVKRVLESEAKS
ncbi:MAG: SRPBCC family protein [Candidatus Bathyarchaeia archaeon]|jgi:uncharacterized protein YndB with AHSA1/START domain